MSPLFGSCKYLLFQPSPVFWMATLCVCVCFCWNHHYIPLPISGTFCRGHFDLSTFWSTLATWILEVVPPNLLSGEFRIPTAGIFHGMKTPKKCPCLVKETLNMPWFRKGRPNAKMPFRFRECWICPDHPLPVENKKSGLRKLVGMLCWPSLLLFYFFHGPKKEAGFEWIWGD